MRARWRWVALVPAVGLVAGCAGPVVDVAEGPPRRPVIVDTDMGPDDAVALLYLMQNPAIDIEAITVAGNGLAHCAPGVEHVGGLLALTDTEQVPVACGPEEPLEGVKAFPTSWRVATDELSGIDLPPSSAVVEDSAVALISRVLEDASTSVDIVTLGPLTNLALVLRERPDLAPAIGRVLIMGGALDAPGNIARNTLAEWNIWVDAVAADEVLAAGLDVTLVPLDATNDVPQTIYLFETLEQTHDSPAAEAWYGFLAANPFQYNGTQYLWDQATAVLLTQPELATYEEAAVGVERGQREVHGHTVRRQAGPVINVATAIDRDALEDHLLSTLLGHDVDRVEPHPDVAVVHDDAPSLAAAEHLTAGQVVVDVTNRTTEPVGVALLRLTDGATEEDLRSLTRPEPPEWLEVLIVLDVEGGDTLTAVLQLEEPGEYWVANVTGPDERPVVLGMVTLQPA